MILAMTILYVLAFATFVAALLERTHRRASALPHSPLGRPADRDLERVLDDLRQVAAPGEPAERPARLRTTTTAPAVCRPVAS